MIKLVITFTGKTNAINYSYKLSDTRVTCIHGIKDSGVLLDSDLLFHHVDYIFFNSLRTSGLVRMLTTFIYYCYVLS